ncbi:hypothetical protein M2323_004155 [Rhodoblastus acidophilus]|uniref:hypothetical protein n=1 Tax=Rhodoblastus acidophilus TaxID=1074 RepID=UPI0022246C69|nr:hypothetical protein [Rhodoblastus acidophilus]MCW2286314.1 hypothetical protein [Rhodoblastus acidophilus]MCW2335209.1 hypothetical protein [Rhodoblastus acidophilus]
MAKVLIRDAANARRDEVSFTFDWSESRIVLASTLIEERVRAEADKIACGAAPSRLYAELRDGLDTLVDEIAARAVKAFARGAFFLIVNDRQVTDPQERIDLSTTTEVVFLKLVPLRGG